MSRTQPQDWIQKRRAFHNLFLGWVPLPCVCHFKNDEAILFDYSGLISVLLGAACALTRKQRRPNPSDRHDLRASPEKQPELGV